MVWSLANVQTNARKNYMNSYGHHNSGSNRWWICVRINDDDDDDDDDGDNVNANDDDDTMPLMLALFVCVTANISQTHHRALWLCQENMYAS